jgi:hypothetical protein
MFAPIIMGIALGTVSTPPPTKPTTMEVVVEELWISEVASIPMNKPTSGLEVLVIRVSARSLPNIFIEVPIRSMLNRNKYRQATSWIKRKYRCNR